MLVHCTGGIKGRRLCVWFIGYDTIRHLERLVLLVHSSGYEWLLADVRQSAMMMMMMGLPSSKVEIERRFAKINVSEDHRG